MTTAHSLMSNRNVQQTLDSVDERITHLTELYSKTLKAFQTNDPSFNDFFQQYSDFLLDELSRLQQTRDPDANVCQKWLSLLESQWTSVDAAVEAIRSHVVERFNFELFPALVALYPYAASASRSLLVMLARHGKPREMILLVFEQLPATDEERNDLLLQLAMEILERLGKERVHFLPGLFRAIMRLLHPATVTSATTSEKGSPSTERNERNVFAISFANEAEERAQRDLLEQERAQSKLLARYLPMLLTLLQRLCSSLPPRHSSLQPCRDESPPHEHYLVIEFLLTLIAIVLPHRETFATALCVLVNLLLSQIDVYYLLTHATRTNAGPLTRKTESAAKDTAGRDPFQATSVDAIEERWSNVGLGGVVYTLLLQGDTSPSTAVSAPSSSVPRVYSNRWLLVTVLPYVTALLRHPSLRVMTVGVELITHLSTEFVEGNSLQLDSALGLVSRDDGNPFLDVIHAFIDYIIRVPNQETRLAHVRTLHALISLVAFPARFELLAKVCQASPYAHVTAALIDHMKYDITEAILLSRNSPSVWLPAVLKIVTFVLQPSADIGNHTECVIASLNCLRFLLLKDPVINAATIQAAQQDKKEPPRIDHQRPVRADLYKPSTLPSPLAPTPLVELLSSDLLLKLQTQTLIPFEQWLVTFIQAQLKLAEHRSPRQFGPINPAQFEHSQQQFILQLQLIHTLLVRINELVKIKLKSSSQGYSSM